jgi:hypothetical protein
MPYYAETGRSRPPNRLTLQITLLPVTIWILAAANYVREALAEHF